MVWSLDTRKHGKFVLKLQFCWRLWLKVPTPTSLMCHRFAFTLAYVLRGPSWLILYCAALAPP
ncbi:unnamed protein product [Rhodiola kirilowii]